MASGRLIRVHLPPMYSMEIDAFQEVFPYPLHFFVSSKLWN
jgi:hypothetical protein